MGGGRWGKRTGQQNRRDRERPGLACRSLIGPDRILVALKLDRLTRGGARGLLRLDLARPCDGRQAGHRGGQL